MAQMPDQPAFLAPPAPMIFHPVARELPHAEWEAKAPAFQGLNPAHTTVIVVEDGPGGPVLAQWATFTCVHVEGLAVAPGARGHAGVGRALISEMVRVLTEAGITETLTQIDSPEMHAMLTRLQQAGQAREVPGQTWIIRLTE